MKKNAIERWPLWVLTLTVLVSVGVNLGVQFNKANAAAANVVGLRLIDNGCNDTSYAAIRYASDVNVWSSWAGDDDNYDPDCIRIFLENSIPIDTDIRIGLQARDVNTPCGFLYLFKCGDGGGTEAYTPWASAWTSSNYANVWTSFKKDGVTPKIWTCDKDCFDADQYRIIVETRPWYGYKVSDFKLGIQVGDMGSSPYTVNSGCTDHIGTEVYTASSTATPLPSSWANDGYNIQDFNCIRVNLIAASTLNDPTADLNGTSTAPYGNSVNITWNVQYINTTVGCTLSATNANGTDSTTITTNGPGSKTSLAITEATTYTLSCPGFKTGTTAGDSITITPFSSAATLEFKMDPTSGLSPGDTSVATISARNAQSCTLVGRDVGGSIVDAGYSLNDLPAPSATIPVQPIADVIYLQPGQSPWMVPTDWNSSNNSIEVIGGGGGGGGDGGGSTGAAGGSTTFNTTLVAGGGGGGGPGAAPANGGSGGTASGGNNTNTSGGVGSAGTATSGGAGGSTPNSGAGGASRSTDGAGNPGSNYGGGGGGGCNGTNCGSGVGGGGGGGGGYVKSVNVTLTPGSNITYQIGAAGAGGTGTRAGGAGAQGTIKITYTHVPTTTIPPITSGTQWTVPSDWSNTNTIQVIGGGGGGSSAASGSDGAGGGAYSKITNTTALSQRSVVTIAVGAGGPSNTPGGDTYVCSSQSNCSSIAGSAVIVGAKGGSAGASGGGTGGAAASGYPTSGTCTIGAANMRCSGGNGGNASSDEGGAGGGGAGGPKGVGGLGGNSDRNEGGGGGGNGGGSRANNANSDSGPSGPGGDGNCSWGCGGMGGYSYGGAYNTCKLGNTQSNIYGAGCMGDGDGQNGGAGSIGGGGGGADDGSGLARGGHGGNGIDLNGLIGSGGGGGGGAEVSYSANVGGNGGLYGGGGGGAGSGNGGTGGNGVIYISYTPGATVADNVEAKTSNHTVNVTTDYTVSCLGYDNNTVSKTVRVSLSACRLDGVTINNGASSGFYQYSIAPTGQTCGTQELRTCTNGQLSGPTTHIYKNCTVQSGITLTANNISIAASVRKGTAVALSWNGGNASSCTITGTDGFSFTMPDEDGDTATNLVGTQSVTINQKTIYTASCTLGASTKQATVTVNILPTFINQ